MSGADGAAAQPGARRTGFGTDRHPFGPGDGLWLGGVEIPGAPRLHGHSDGDAALHAVAGALLGAAALGDLGELYPADDRTPEGVPSARLMRDVVARLGGAGWRPAAVDLTIRGARPRLAGHLPAMRDAVSGLLGVDADAVSVKASTGNLSGDAGAGRVIEAEALATIVRVSGSTLAPVCATPCPARSSRSSRSSQGTFGSTAAGRRSTDRPTLATFGRSCSPTCSSGTCATAGSRSRG